MRKLLSKFWIQIAFLDVDFDIMDAIAIDILAINAGGEYAMHFQGSFFMLYWEPGYGYMGRPPHLVWDIFYLRQWWLPKALKDS